MLWSGQIKRGAPLSLFPSKKKKNLNKKKKVKGVEAGGMVAPEPTCPDSSGCKQVIRTGGTWGGDLSSTTSRKKSPPGGTCGHFDQIKFKEEFQWMRLVHHF